MEHVDLLYSGLMFAAGMLSVWTVLLVTATFATLSPSLRKTAATTATISSRERHVPAHQVPVHHGAEKATPPRSVSEALPQRPVLGRALRPIQ
jgi:hypothetical protein